ncbi:MAG TPA: hypothetical protein VKW04_16110 [Planctomycetota bacterium]|nr:hypothetical protein [Planctomycetota bacterium]
MKYLPFLALLCCTAGCGLFGSSDSASNSAAAPADPREAERADQRNKLAQKRQDLAQTDSDLSKVASERDSLSKEEASEKKTNRLVELARMESDLKQRKASQEDEIAQLQQQLGGPAPAAKKPEKAGDALDDLLATNENKDKEDADRRRRKADEEAAADKNRIAQAETARKAELDERAKQKIEGGRPAAGEDGPAFEDRWADVIQKVREEVQKYKKF